MEQRPDSGRLTDLIYASLLGERRWDEFLDELRRALPNGKAMLFFHDASAGRGAFTMTSGVEPVSVAAYEDHFSAINPWMPGASTRPLGRVVRADAMLPRKLLAGTEFHGDWLRPQGLESGIGVTIFREDDCNFMVSVLGADADDAVYDEAVELLQDLVPHLRRAFLRYRMSPAGSFGRLGGDRSGTALRIGMISVGSGRKVRAMNGFATTMLEGSPVLSVNAAGRLDCASPVVIDCIDAVLRSWMHTEPGAEPKSFVLAADGRSSPVRLTVFAPSGERQEAFFRGPECVVFVENLGAGIESAITEFAGEHRLTAAERRVLAGIVAGLTINEIAATNEIAPTTVRSQLKQVFAKTGIGRQVDLVRHVCLLAGQRA